MALPCSKKPRSGSAALPLKFAPLVTGHHWKSLGTGLTGVDQCGDKGSHLSPPRLLRSFEELRVYVHSIIGSLVIRMRGPMENRHALFSCADLKVTLNP